MTGGVGEGPPGRPSSPPMVVVCGPTATGKTALGIELALAITGAGRPAAVISADSRQVYRGMDVGTAKPTLAERRGVPHHGLDLVDPDEAFSVAGFVAHASDVLADLARAGGVALLVGGTGLYLRAVGRGIDTGALPHDPGLRAGLEARLAQEGLAPLAAELRARAPERAAAVDLHNPRRVVRALEIAILRGDAPPPPPRGYPGPSLWLALSVDGAEHRARIAARARIQFAAGLLEEAEALRRRFDPGLPAFSAIGYHEAWGVIDGRMTLVAAIELDAARNVAFARRQRTWFRSEPGLAWIDATNDPLPEALRRVERFLDTT